MGGPGSGAWWKPAQDGQTTEMSSPQSHGLLYQFLAWGLHPPPQSKPPHRAGSCCSFHCPPGSIRQAAYQTSRPFSVLCRSFAGTSARGERRRLTDVQQQWCVVEKAARLESGLARAAVLLGPSSPHSSLRLVLAVTRSKDTDMSCSLRTLTAFPCVVSPSPPGLQGLGQAEGESKIFL